MSILGIRLELLQDHFLMDKRLSPWDHIVRMGIGFDFCIGAIVEAIDLGLYAKAIVYKKRAEEIMKSENLKSPEGRHMWKVYSDLWAKLSLEERILIGMIKPEEEDGA